MDEHQAIKDAEHLKLLVLFHYIYGGMLFLLGCLPAFYVGIGLLIALSPASVGPAGRGAPPPQFVGWIMTAFGMVFLAFEWGIAALAIYGGRCLSKRRKHTFCMIESGVLCINVPMGTALGVCSLIVLSRPSVKELFQKAAAEEEAVPDNTIS